MGLGAVHPLCRATHFGFMNNYAEDGWTNTEWTGFNMTTPRFKDEGINLNFRFASVDPGASVTFTWLYALAQDAVDTALATISRCVTVIAVRERHACRGGVAVPDFRVVASVQRCHCPARHPGVRVCRGIQRVDDGDAVSRSVFPYWNYWRC